MSALGFASPVQANVILPNLGVEPFAKACIFRRELRSYRIFHNRSRIPKMSTSLPSDVAVVEIGMGTDLHGQNVTAAAARACKNAIEFNSLPGLARLLPDGDFSKMQVHVKLGVPEPFQNDVDIDTIKSQFPYGTVTVEIELGGLLCSSGVVLKEQGDEAGDQRAIVVVAAVSVIC